ncbi:MAG: hypothetical protein Harvfovirus35_1, partial [Harvfovirus sp.]
QKLLGDLYFDGRATEIDYDEAIKMYRLSASQGYAQGQADLGWMYFHGVGVPRDYSEGLKWFRLAAEQNNMFSQKQLGFMYQHGFGLEKDMDKALYYYSLAALQNDSDTIGSLAGFNEKIHRTKGIGLIVMAKEKERQMNELMMNKIKFLEKKIADQEVEITHLRYIPHGKEFKNIEENFYSLALKN